MRRRQWQCHWSTKSGLGRSGPGQLRSAAPQGLHVLTLRALGRCGVVDSTPDRQSGGVGLSPSQCIKIFGCVAKLCCAEVITCCKNRRMAMDSEHKVESCSWHFPYRRRWHQSVPVWELQLALSCIGGAGITHFPIVSDTQTVRVWPCAAVGFN